LHLSRYVLLACTAVPLFAHADVPVSVVRGLFSGESVSVEDTLAVADEFRTGVGAGIWQSDCLAKYFYGLAIDYAATVPGLLDSPLLQKAASDYEFLKHKSNEPCQVSFHGPQPASVPLKYLVSVNGKFPGTVPSPMAPYDRPQPEPVLPLRPVAGIVVPADRVLDIPQLPGPVATGLSADKVMTARKPFGAAPGKSDWPDRATAATAPVVLETTGNDCTAKWTQYGYLQEAMRDYARMSFFVYAGTAPINRTIDTVDDLGQRLATAKAADVKFLLKHQLAAAEGASRELIARRERKQELAAAGYIARTDLQDAFFRATKLNWQKLESEDFEFEIYERGGHFVVAFRGTSLPSGWLSDARQIMSIDVGRGLYEYADQLLKFLIKSGIDRRHISTTGHSLGGGLAAYSHIRNDTAFAMTFNPAEVSAANDKRASNTGAQKRVFNYISYVPGTDAADFVSQGTQVAKELVRQPLIDLPDGHLYGSKYYLPIPVGASEWKLAKMAAYAGGAMGAAPGGVAQALLVAAGSAAVTPDERINTAKARVAEVTVAHVAKNAIFHPFRTIALGAVSAVEAHRRVAPIENLTWGVFNLHIMQPLEESASLLFVDPQSVVCAGPATPAFVTQQLDTTSRAGNFLKLAAKIATAPK
jgi:hypothetical protein